MYIPPPPKKNKKVDKKNNIWKLLYFIWILICLFYLIVWHVFSVWVDISTNENNHRWESFHRRMYAKNCLFFVFVFFLYFFCVMFFSPLFHVHVYIEMSSLPAKCYKFLCILVTRDYCFNMIFKWEMFLSLEKQLMRQIWHFFFQGDIGGFHKSIYNMFVFFVVFIEVEQWPHPLYINV